MAEFDEWRSPVLTAILACLAATCACHGKPPVLAGGPATRIELAHPMRPSQTIISVDLAPGEQIEWSAPACEAEEVTGGHWIRSLKQRHWIVQSGWSSVTFYGLRFRRSDGVYGDLYSTLTINERHEACSNYVIRIQRARDGHPVPWRRPFSIAMEGKPHFYFPDDPNFPAE